MTAPALLDLDYERSENKGRQVTWMLWLKDAEHHNCAEGLSVACDSVDRLLSEIVRLREALTAIADDARYYDSYTLSTLRGNLDMIQEQARAALALFRGEE